MASRLWADVSSNNGPIDVEAYAKAGHLILGVKATQGTDYYNPYHTEQVTAAIVENISVAHYHFADPANTVSPNAEASWFVGHCIARLRPRDYVVLDYERFLAGGPSRDNQWIQRFDQEVRRQLHRSVILYMSQSPLDAHGNDCLPVSRLVWVAAYGGPPAPIPSRARLWSHQQSDGTLGPLPHRLPGIGKCDVSVMRARTFAYQLTQRTLRRR